MDNDVRKRSETNSRYFNDIRLKRLKIIIGKLSNGLGTL